VGPPLVVGDGQHPQFLTGELIDEAVREATCWKDSNVRSRRSADLGMHLKESDNALDLVEEPAPQAGRPGFIELGCLD
jgi:hypothetical protein